MKLELPPDAPRRAARLGRRLLPLAVLAIQIVVSFQFQSHTNRLKLNMMMDTGGFRQVANAPTLTYALAHHRTLVYPALLRYFESAGRGWKGIPKVQAVIAFAAAVLFFLGLASYAGSRWLALAAATPLVWARSNVFLAWAQSDSLAVSLSLASVGLLLWLAARPHNPWLWASLTLAVLATYHTRPSTLFLVGLVPVLGVLLRLCRSATGLRALGRWGLGLAAATLAPYLLFATLRWATVGHFGLVSFGGANLIGITASFIDQQVIEALPPELQIPARRIRARRHDEGWTPMDPAGDPQPYFDQYNDNVWQIALPVTRRRLRELAEEAGPTSAAGGPASRAPPEGHRDRWVALNGLMKDLSVAIIRVKPYHYLNWIWQALGLGLSQLLEDGWILWPLVLLGLSMPFAWLRGPGGAGVGAPADSGEQAGDGRRTTILLGLLALALAYFTAYMLLVCLVSYPIGRYTIATAILLPPVLCAVLFEVWRRILRPALPAS